MPTAPRPVLVHTTDLSGDDLPAFHHACALAAISGGRLVTLHGDQGGGDARALPDAAPLSARWGRAIDHERRCHSCCDEVADTVIDGIRQLAPTLVVAGTHARHGLSALLHGSVAEAVARNMVAPTLIVPNRARGFVDPATGALELRRVLVAAGSPEERAHGLAAARLLVDLAGATGAELRPLHVDDEDRVVASILAAARDGQACAIVMATRGHDGLADVLRGSRTEQVLRDAACPVLTVALPAA